MGVNGLTTYLRNHRLAIARNVELHRQDSNGDNQIQERIKRTHIVVDGWSFIYVAYQESHLPWAYGGEYDQFSVFIQKIVEAWLELGIRLSFVFDGPEETIKFPTSVSRLTSTQVHHSELFFRTSRSARTTPRFLGETRIIPPLVYPACTETLLKLSSQYRDLDVYFADREADPFIVELAGRLGAYVTGSDSDFVVLNTPGYLGYIPLESFEWKLEATPDLPRTRTISIASSATSFSISDFGSDGSILDDLAEFDDGGFVPVRKKRTRITAAKAKILPASGPGQLPAQRSLIPPEEYSSLIFSVYTPEAVALSLGIPVALLPLLGAIVGNDFTHAIKSNAAKPTGASVLPGYTHQKLLFEHKLNAAQRVAYAANNLSAVLRGVDKKSKKRVRPKQRSVLELIRSTVTQMLVRPEHVTEGEIDGIVNGIVESALQYAIPPPPAILPGQPRLWPTPFCALHQDITECDLEPFVSEPLDEGESQQQQQEVLAMVQNQYLRLYREGSMDPQVLDIIVTGTMWPRLFLENPDHASASGQADASGALREWVYAIIDQGIGVYVPLPPDEEDEGSVNSGDIPLLTNGKQPAERQVESSEDEDDDEVIDVMDEDDLEEAGDPLVALKGALQRLRGVSSAGMSGGLPTIPDQDGESDEEGSVEGGELEECYVTEYVRKGHRVAESPVLVKDLNALLEKAVERDNGQGTSENFGRPSMHNHTVPRTSRSHPIQLAEERERLCVLLMACGSDTQRVRNLVNEWVGPVIITRWLIRWAGVVEKERVCGGGGSARFVANPLLKTWSRGEIAALLCAFSPEKLGEEHAEGEGLKMAKISGSSSSSLDMSDRAVQLMARALSVTEAIRMLIHVLCLTTRVPLHFSRFKGRVFHEGCREGLGGETTVQRLPTTATNTIDTAVLAAVEEGLEEYIREDSVKKAKKKKEGKAAAAAAVKLPQRGISFNLLAQLDASA